MKELTVTPLDLFMNDVVDKNPNEPEFHQAVREVSETVIPYIEENPKYKKANILQRIIEPERTIIFRVPWMDDQGNVHVNRGYRVQFSSTLGPYKGGLRFHPSVNLGVIKFLGFEQVFKNALTTLPLGGAKGGSNFDPKGRSENEIMRFCQSFMTALHLHISKHTDVPAGDIGVGPREIGYLFGQFKRIHNEFSGILTGKRPNWGGSFIRLESTGYGTVYFIQEMLAEVNDSFKGKNVVVSGSGNVAQFAMEKASVLGGKVIGFSDSTGHIHVPNGMSFDMIEEVKFLKNEKRGTISELAEKYSDTWYYEGERVWNIPDKVDIAIPCATENELDENDARKLIEKGVRCVGEGANMPTTTEAMHLFQSENILFAPGKAANAGGVATSGFEMAQNSARITWDHETVDKKLQTIMKNIHRQCVTYGNSQKSGHINYVRGANLAGFVKVADSMIEQGLV